MSGVTFTVEIDDQAMQTRLEEMLTRMEQPFKFYKAAGEYLTEIAIPRNFDHEQGPDGTPWAALKEATIRRREKLGQTPIRILRAGGSAASLSASIVAQPSHTEVRVGSATEYAAVHQFGAAKGAFGADSHGRPLPWGTIPARPFLGLSTEDGQELIRIAEDWLAVE